MLVGVSVDRERDPVRKNRHDRGACERFAAPRAAQRHEQRGVERDGLGRDETKAAHRQIRAMLLAQFFLTFELDGEGGGGGARDFHDRGVSSSFCNRSHSAK